MQTVRTYSRVYRAKQTLILDEHITVQIQDARDTAPRTVALHVRVESDSYEFQNKGVVQVFQPQHGWTDVARLMPDEIQDGLAYKHDRDPDATTNHLKVCAGVLWEMAARVLEPWDSLEG